MPGDPLQGLNEAQREAVSHAGSPLAVLAGPGTGKTRVITRRVAHMIEARGIDPGKIVALTFTNKAGEELRDRLAELLSRSVAESVHCFTFHAFGRRLLRRFADIAGLGVEPQLTDSAQERRLLRELVDRGGHFREYAGEGLESAIDRTRRVMRDLEQRAMPPAEAIARVEDRLGGLGADPEHAGERGELRRYLEAARLGEAYAREREARGWVGYSDMILRPIALLRDSEIVRDICHNDYRHYVVDEFQDVDRAQVELLKALAPPASNPDLCVVGDDDQSIYAFRGADELAFARFDATWDGSRTIPLRESYRSQEPIVRAAHAVIRRASSRFAPDKVVERADTLASEKPAPGAGVGVVALEEYTEDGEAIAAMVRTALEREPGRRRGDFAVIARTHADLGRIHTALEIEGVPTRIARTPSPFEDDGVRDVMAWVDVILDPEAVWAAQRLLWRPPMSVEPATIAAWGRAYRRARAEAEAGTGEHGTGGFLAWLGSVGGAEHEAARTRISELRTGLVALAAKAPADEAIAGIVRESGAAHAELLGARERARRVAALVALLRFARARRDRLEAPGDLRAFREYLNELDDSERNKAAGDPGDVLEPESADAEDADAVTLLTAHAAKGLEFDTVFLPRVMPQHGYPKSRRDDDEATPAAVLEAFGEECGDAAARHEDEERRVFYVALTRARRRLEMLAKIPKKTNALHFTLELLDDGLATRRDSSDVFVEADEAGVSSVSRGALDRESARYAARVGRGVRLTDARRAARLDAAEALDGADLAGSGAGETAGEDAIAAMAERMARDAWRLAAVAHVEAHGRAPEWAQARGVGDEARALAASINAGGAEEAPDVAPALAMKPPLSLSYSAINAYEQCPRCYYLRRVLGLDEAPSDALLVGNIVHEALEKLVSERMVAESEGREGPALSTLAGRARAKLARAMAARGETDAGLGAQVEALAGAGAGMLDEPGVQVLEVERSLRFPFECAGHEHTITAKLDRIDQLHAPDGGTLLRIVDYKTGRASKKLLEPKKDDLQMCIYAMAVRHEFGCEARGVAEYWVLSTGQRGRIGLDELDLDKARNKMGRAIEGMLAGEFSSKAKTCTGPCSIFGGG